MGHITYVKVEEADTHVIAGSIPGESCRYCVGEADTISKAPRYTYVYSCREVSYTDAYIIAGTAASDADGSCGEAASS